MYSPLHCRETSATTFRLPRVPVLRTPAPELPPFEGSLCFHRQRAGHQYYSDEKAQSATEDSRLDRSPTKFSGMGCCEVGASAYLPDHAFDGNKALKHLSIFLRHTNRLIVHRKGGTSQNSEARIRATVWLVHKRLSCNLSPVPKLHGPSCSVRPMIFRYREPFSFPGCAALISKRRSAPSVDSRQVLSHQTARMRMAKSHRPCKRDTNSRKS